MTNIDLPDWCRDLFNEDARYFALVGGRGSGKSYSVAACLVLRAAAKPLRILCAREIQKSIKDSVKRLLDDIKAGKVSINSPVARARIGKSEGDTAEVQAPGGVRAYEIVNVDYV